MIKLPPIIPEEHRNKRGLPYNPFLKYIWNRVHEYNKSFIMSIYGKPGAGKSYACLTMGSVLSKRFTKDNIFFYPEDFTEAIFNLKKKGEVLMYDEPETTLSSRKWQSLENMMTTDVINICRFKNPIIFFALPSFGGIDKQARLATECVAEARRSKKQPGKIIPRRISRGMDDKEVRRTYRVTINNMSRKIGDMVIPYFPPEELRLAYEERAEKYKNELMRRRTEEMKGVRESRKSKSELGADFADSVFENLEDFTHNKRISKSLIQHEFGVSRDRALLIKQLVERKIRGKKEDES